MRNLIAALLVLSALPSLAHSAGKRVAVVVGAGAYAAVPALPNPPRDARGVAAALKRLGFDTALVLDPDRAALETAIRGFGERAQDADAAVFFFAGHGVEAGGRNLLVPVTARVAGARDLPFETVDLDLVLGQLDGRARAVLIFLDACRDNPFLRSLSGPGASAGRGIGARGGLAAPASDVSGTLIAFATAPGHVASDGEGEHSPFTAALLHHIEAPGVEVRQMLAAVRKEVREATSGQQIPWDSSALEGEFYFRPTASAGAPRAALNVPAVLPGAPAATPRCHVPRLTGRMREGGATGTMRVVSDGRGCGFSVWRRRATHEPYEGLQVTAPPRDGTVRIEEQHRIVYTPRPGFAGADQFTVTSTPRGTVTIQVTASAPEP